MKNSRFILTFAVTLVACLASLSSWSSEGVDAERLALLEKMYADFRDDFSGIGEVSADTLMEWISAGEVVIVDVREPAEREVSRLPNSIIPKELESYLEGHDNLRVVIYCTIGYRSGKFTRSLKNKGLKASNLAGGIVAWVHHGGPIEHDGKPTRRVHVYGKKWNLLPEGYEPVW